MPEQTSVDKVIEKSDEIFQTIRRLGNGRYDADDANYCVELIINAIRDGREDLQKKFDDLEQQYILETTGMSRQISQS
jgi:hypothetical protein